MADPFNLARFVEAQDTTYGQGAGQILGGMDAVKFRSSLTLFRLADGKNPLFDESLQRFFGGDPDPLTLEALEKLSSP